ncbi:MAG TPA: PAS domain-containing protein [Acidimicrobiia bacterium]|nr:PAS domain-containing protein [Acidimicrobiia bacterium]
MAVDPIEIILLRQWASYIAVPTWITDTEGRLLYYNESVESIIGMRFEEADELPAEELVDRFAMTEVDGSPISNYDRPLIIALTKQMPAHRRIGLRNTDGTIRELEVTAIPILSTGDRHLGAMATIWDPNYQPDSTGQGTKVKRGQYPIEVILTRHWASYLAVPIWITNRAGNLVYCNQPAEAVTGARYEAGDFPAAVHAELFKVCDLDGSPLANEDLPITIALTKGVASHRPLRFCGLDGTWRNIEATALPLVGQGERLLGSVAMFWEVDP